MLTRCLTCLVGCYVACSSLFAQENEALRQEAEAAMKKAATYYYSQVAYRGGYVYYYSLDLKIRWGEGVAAPTQIWVQPPGTPTVGLAYLDAFEATGDEFYLQAATAAAEALIYGQLQSGGWEHAIDFDPQGGRTGQYRNGQGRGKNNSTFDDDKTQAALLLMMKCDQAHEFKHEKIHESALYGLNAVLQAQFPNGAFPQVFSGPVSNQPILKASYPNYNWRTENRIKEYWDLYTLNDDLAGDLARTLLAAQNIYDDARCTVALKRLGDFLILAQMPDPQPAWAQQYSFAMHPCWARKFEPPAITAHESQDAIRTLMLVYQQTGEEKYLAPISRALDYLDTCVLPDGQIARFYELQSNRPLYMTKDYQLTYNDNDLPTHYGFKQGQKLSQLRAEYVAMKAGTWQAPQRSAKELVKRAKASLEQLDAQGRWVSGVSGDRIAGQPKFGDVHEYLSSEVFAERLTDLAALIRARH